MVPRPKKLKQKDTEEDVADQENPNHRQEEDEEEVVKLVYLHYLDHYLN